VVARRASVYRAGKLAIAWAARSVAVGGHGGAVVCLVQKQLVRARDLIAQLVATALRCSSLRKLSDATSGERWVVSEQ